MLGKSSIFNISSSAGEGGQINSDVSAMEHRDGMERGRPTSILHFGGSLSDVQRILLDNLRKCGDEYTDRSGMVTMYDLSALTAKERVEFAMFERGDERLIVRGDEGKVNIDVFDAEKLNADGYKWSGHTHPMLLRGLELDASSGDYQILSRFDQEESVIYNVKGEYQTFRNILR
jgi:hypothetical protein